MAYFEATTMDPELQALVWSKMLKTLEDIGSEWVARRPALSVDNGVITHTIAGSTTDTSQAHAPWHRPVSVAASQIDVLPSIDELDHTMVDLTVEPSNPTTATPAVVSAVVARQSSVVPSAMDEPTIPSIAAVQDSPASQPVLKRSADAAVHTSEASVEAPVLRSAASAVQSATVAVHAPSVESASEDRTMRSPNERLRTQAFNGMYLVPSDYSIDQDTGMALDPDRREYLSLQTLLQQHPDIHGVALLMHMETVLPTRQICLGEVRVWPVDDSDASHQLRRVLANDTEGEKYLPLPPPGSVAGLYAHTAAVVKGLKQWHFRRTSKALIGPWFGGWVFVGWQPMREDSDYYVVWWPEAALQYRCHSTERLHGCCLPPINATDDWWMDPQSRDPKRYSRNRRRGRGRRFDSNTADPQTPAVSPPIAGHAAQTSRMYATQDWRTQLRRSQDSRQSHRILDTQTTAPAPVATSTDSSSTDDTAMPRVHSASTHARREASSPRRRSTVSTVVDTSMPAAPTESTQSTRVRRSRRSRSAAEPSATRLTHSTHRARSRRRRAAVTSAASASDGPVNSAVSASATSAASVWSGQSRNATLASLGVTTQELQTVESTIASSAPQDSSDARLAATAASIANRTGQPSRRTRSRHPRTDLADEKLNDESITLASSSSEAEEAVEDRPRLDGEIPPGIVREPCLFRTHGCELTRPVPPRVSPFPLHRDGTRNWHTELFDIQRLFRTSDISVLPEARVRDVHAEIRRVAAMARWFIGRSRLTPQAWHICKIEETLALMSFLPLVDMPYPYKPIGKGNRFSHELEERMIERATVLIPYIRRPIDVRWPELGPVEKEMEDLVCAYDSHLTHHGVSGQKVENHRVVCARQHHMYTTELERRREEYYQPQDLGLLEAHHNRLSIYRATRTLDDECEICMQPLLKNECLVTPGCLHSLHFACAVEYWSRHNACPKCRREPVPLE